MQIRKLLHAKLANAGYPTHELNGDEAVEALHEIGVRAYWIDLCVPTADALVSNLAQYLCSTFECSETYMCTETYDSKLIRTRQQLLLESQHLRNIGYDSCTIVTLP